MKQETPFDSNRTSGRNLPFWMHDASPSFASLTSDDQADVVVVGGGLSGLTTAYCLLQAGKSVILLEDGEIGSGESGRTTAHITAALDDRYYDLERIFDEGRSRLAAQSHTEAIEWIAGTVAREGIECHFKRVDGYLFRHETDKPENLDKELEAAQRAGLVVEMTREIPALHDIPEGRAIRYRQQAQFHILKYLSGLAAAIVRMGGRICTRSKVTEVREGEVRANGHSVKAGGIVVATNSPVNDIVTMHTKQAPYRSYVLGFRVAKGAMPHALWWDTGDQESRWPSYPYHYVRLEEYDATSDILIVGGEDHKTGQAESEDIPEEQRYVNLERWTREHFPQAGDIVSRWSGQVMEPVDALGFMGRNPGDDHIYIITGDSGNGMTHGTIGGKLVCDLIRGVSNPYEKLYDPARISFSTGGDFIREQANVGKQYLDWLTPEEKKDAEQLLPGQGAVIGGALGKKAAWRNADGQISVFSAVCPHMGCVVRWNADETTFDCPCHGSRFSVEGEVLNGPAITGLKRLENEEDNQ